MDREEFEKKELEERGFANFDSFNSFEKELGHLGELVIESFYDSRYFHLDGLDLIYRIVIDKEGCAPDFEEVIEKIVELVNKKDEHSRIMLLSYLFENYWIGKRAGVLESLDD